VIRALVVGTPSAIPAALFQACRSGFRRHRAVLPHPGNHTGAIEFACLKARMRIVTSHSHPCRQNDDRIGRDCLSRRDDECIAQQNRSQEHAKAGVRDGSCRHPEGVRERSNGVALLVDLAAEPPPNNRIRTGDSLRPRFWESPPAFGTLTRVRSRRASPCLPGVSPSLGRLVDLRFGRPIAARGNATETVVFSS
jgi:hypothetical protein